MELGGYSFEIVRDRKSVVFGRVRAIGIPKLLYT